MTGRSPSLQCLIAIAVKQLETEDTGVILVRFASGAIGEILTSWAFSLVGPWSFEVGAEHGSWREADSARPSVAWLAGGS